MDYKKAYITALAKAREIHSFSSDLAEIKCMEQIFPSLQESEDEKIRKALIRYHQSTLNIDGVKGEEILAWLEKQGEIDKTSYEISEKEKCEFIGDGFIKCYADFLDFKEGETYWLEYIGNDEYNVRSDNLLGKTYHITPCQLYTIFKKQTWFEEQGEQKPVDKIEPKFHEGDWIVFNGLILHIDEVVNGYYRTTSIGGIHNSYDWNIDNAARLWTIQDVKDGDVLSNEDMILIFKEFEIPAYKQYIIAYIGLDSCGHIQVTDGHWTLGIDKAKPATKEQRDLLFQKMKEAGYEWDEDKKELSRIEKQNKNLLPYIPKFKVGDKLVSTRNPRLTYEVLNAGNVNELGNLEYEIEIFTDKKPGIQVGDTFKEHNIHLMECAKVDEWAKLVDEAIPKWSEEDEKIMNFCISRIQDELEALTNNKFANQEILQDYKEGCWERIDWLKSLKQRMEE